MKTTVIIQSLLVGILGIAVTLVLAHYLLKFIGQFITTVNWNFF